MFKFTEVEVTRQAIGNDSYIYRFVTSTARGTMVKRCETRYYSGSWSHGISTEVLTESDDFKPTVKGDAKYYANFNDAVAFVTPIAFKNKAE